MDKNQPTRKYFGGGAKNLGVVKQLPPNSFPELIRQVLQLPVTLNLSRDEYHRLPPAERNRYKRVSYITPCTFNPPITPALPTPSPHPAPGTIPRRRENAGHIVLLCLDLDESPGTLTLRRAINATPGILAPQLDPFAFVVYRTASHTDDNPRLRLLVDACNLPLDSHTRAMEDIARRIGLPAAEITPESTVPVQPMFLPTRFERDTDNEHPLIYTLHIDRRGYHQEDLDNAIAEALLGPSSTNSPNSSHPSQPSSEPAPRPVDDPLSPLDYLRPPLRGCTVAHVGDALRHISPDLPYADWIRIAAALKHQFPRSPEDEEAYELFDRWSRKGDKYVSPQDTRAKWESFHQTPRNRLPVTIHTLFHWAAEKGWSPLSLTSACFQEVQEWLGSEADIPEDRFIELTLGRIAAIPRLGFTQQDSLLRLVCERANAVFGMTLRPATLKKDLDNMRKREAELRKREARLRNPVESNTPPWANGLVFVEGVDMFYRLDAGNFYSPMAIDRAYGRHMLKLQEDTDDPSSMVADKKKGPVKATDYLLNHLQISTVYAVVYDPTTRDSILETPDRNLRFANRFRPDHCKPKPDQASYAEDVLMEHLDKLVVEKEYQTLLLDFFTHMVQNPGRKIRWAVVLQGAEGCGKTFLHQMMIPVLGKTNASIVQRDALETQWNEWATGSLLLTFEEIRVSNKNRHEVMDRLKPLITNDTIAISERFKNTIVVPNYTNYLLFTNHHDALPLGNKDRRYFILKARQQTAQDVREMGGDEYFNRLFSMLDTHAGGLRHFFETRTISSGFYANARAPRTHYAEELIRSNSHPLTQFIMECLEDREKGAPVQLITRDVISSRNLTQAAELAGIDVPGPKVMTTMLQEMGYHYVGRVALRDENRHGLYVRWPLPEGKDAVVFARTKANEDLDPQGGNWLL